MDDCGVYRTEETLTRARDDLAGLKERYQPLGVQDKGTVFNTGLLEVLELGCLLDLAQATVASALARKESRGGPLPRRLPRPRRPAVLQAQPGLPRRRERDPGRLQGRGRHHRREGRPGRPQVSARDPEVLRPADRRRVTDGHDRPDSRIAEDRRRWPPTAILLRNIPWELYERLREEEANWGVRMAYDDGDLELMSPSQRHEEIGYRFEHVHGGAGPGPRVQVQALAKTTWKKLGGEGQGGRRCYYIANFDGRHKQGSISRLTLRPTWPSRSRFPGVPSTLSISMPRSACPEIWRFDGENFTTSTIRQPDGLTLSSRSTKATPCPSCGRNEVVYWMTKADEDRRRHGVEAQAGSREWARVELAPRNRPALTPTSVSSGGGFPPGSVESLLPREYRSRDGLKEIDLDVAPPPDLAVEVEISRKALNSLNIYAALGVPEIWRFDGEDLPHPPPPGRWRRTRK